MKARFLTCLVAFIPASKPSKFVVKLIIPSPFDDGLTASAVNRFATVRY